MDQEIVVLPTNADPSNVFEASPPEQTPAWQASPDVQASPSSQPAESAVNVHPVDALQESEVHEFSSSHVRGSWTQPHPDVHESFVHASPSSQIAGRCAHPPPARHTSTVHESASSQVS